MTKLIIQSNYSLEELNQAYFNLYGVNAGSESDIIRFIEAIIDPVIQEIFRTNTKTPINSH